MLILLSITVLVIVHHSNCEANTYSVLLIIPRGSFPAGVLFDMFNFVFDIRDKYRRARTFLLNIAPIISLLSIFAASPDKDSRGGAR